MRLTFWIDPKDKKKLEREAAKKKRKGGEDGKMSVSLLINKILKGEMKSPL